MSSFKVDLLGLDRYIQKIQKAQKDIQVEVDAELEAAGNLFVAGAKKDLARQGGDTGRLLNSIGYRKEKALDYVVFADTFYAPFVEFGTKGKYSPIPGTEEIAAQYKGIKRGSFNEFLEAIKQWVKRKGIVATYSVKTRKRSKSNKAEAERTEQAAWAIAMSILRNGISPKPFFFTQINPVKTQVRRRLEELLNGI